jgi:hypothetical protein
MTRAGGAPSAGRIAALALACWAGGCGGSPSVDSSRGNVRIGDENNYTTTATLSIPSVDTAPGVDLDICWTHVTDDLQCHPVSAQSDVDNVALMRLLHLSKMDVERELGAGQLAESQVAGYVEHHTDHASTCVKLSQFSFFGTAIDVPSEYTESVSYTYLLLFATGTKPGIGARDMLFLNPTAASANTSVDATTGCGLLDFVADLSMLKKLPVSAKGPWMADWADITRDGQNNPAVFQKIDGLTIGLFEDMTVMDLQAKILDIELIATSLWDIPLTGGKTADLAQARDRKTGAPFTGFQPATNATWMLALTCSTCQSPAPIVLAILQPQ